MLTRLTARREIGLGLREAGLDEDAKKGRNKHVGPRSGPAIKVQVTDAKRATIQTHAELTGLPVSAYLRRLGTGYLPPSIIDRDMLIELARLRGDIGRFGGLLKLWLVDKPGEALSEAEVRAALDATIDLQAKVIDLLTYMREAVSQHDRKKRS